MQKVTLLPDEIAALNDLVEALSDRQFDLEQIRAESDYSLVSFFERAKEFVLETPVE